MYNEHLVECGDCNDRFKKIYDSRKAEQEVCVCKCGKLEIYPKLNHSIVNGCGKYKYVPHEEQECKYEYYEEDYKQGWRKAHSFRCGMDSLRIIY